MNQKKYVFNTTPVAYQGVENQFTGYVEVASLWEDTEMSLRIPYSYSTYLDRTLSYIVIKVNGIPRETIRLDELPPSGVLERTLPKGVLQTGGNQISLDWYTRLKEQTLCQDYYTNSNWFVIEAGSEAVVHYNREVVSTIYGYLNYAKHFEALWSVYAPMPTGTGDNLLAVYPQGKIAWQSSPPLEGGGMIIQEYGLLPAALQDKILPPKEGQGVLKLLTTKQQEALLVATAVDEEGFRNLQRLLDYPEKYLKQLDSAELRVANLVSADVSVPIVYELAEVGHYMEGVGNHRVQYFVAYPTNRMIALGSEIVIPIRYAAHLDFEESLVTVYVNDCPVGSKKLSQEEANGDSLQVTIPEHLGIQGGVNITVAFNLQLQDTYCELNGNQVPWAYIAPTSKLYLRSNQMEVENLKYFPYPFVVDYVLQDTALVVADDVTTAELASFYNLLEGSLRYNEGRLLVVRASQIDTIPDDVHVLVIGEPSRNSYLQAQLVANQIVFEESVASFVKNPFSAQKKMVLVAGKTPENLADLVTVMGDRGLRWQIEGKTANYSSGQVHTTELAKVFPQEWEIQQKEEMLFSYLPLGITLGVCMVLLGVFIWKRKKGGE